MSIIRSIIDGNVQLIIPLTSSKINLASISHGQKLEVHLKENRLMSLEMIFLHTPKNIFVCHILYRLVE